MFDLELTKKICNVACDLEEINIDQTKVKYDNDHPFKKYYRLETIIKAINKYKNNEISDECLAHWSCLYCWILNGGFSDDLTEDYDCELEKIIRYEISDVLDSLSFYDGETYYDLNEYIEAFKSLDLLLKDIEKWEGFFTPTENADYNEDQYVVLFNKIDKQFIILYTDYFENGNSYEDLLFVDEEEYNDKLNTLIQLGYKELSYFHFSENED